MNAPLQPVLAAHVNAGAPRLRLPPTQMLDFAPVSRLQGWPGRLMLLAALGAWLAAGLYFEEGRLRLAALDANLAAARAVAAGAPVPDWVKPADPALLAETRVANTVIAALTIPWESLLGAVESVASPDITLLSLEPGADRHTLKISGEARDLPKLFDYLRRLSALETFGTVILQSHQVQVQDPHLPVRFVVSADWKARHDPS